LYDGNVRDRALTSVSTVCGQIFDQLDQTLGATGAAGGTPNG
jgi:hypothetical protein